MADIIYDRDTLAGTIVELAEEVAAGNLDPKSNTSSMLFKRLKSALLRIKMEERGVKRILECMGLTGFTFERGETREAGELLRAVFDIFTMDGLGDNFKTTIAGGIKKAGLKTTVEAALDAMDCKKELKGEITRIFRLAGIVLNFATGFQAPGKRMAELPNAPAHRRKMFA